MKDAKEILKQFDNIFDTDTLKTINFSNMKMLKALYEYFEEDIYTPSPKYSKLRHTHIEIADKLESTFTKEQKKLFEQYWDIGNQMCEEEHLQLFLFGYIIANKLNIESKIK